MTQFYQSPSDKARFDVLLKVLSEEGPNLAIIGDDEVALAHYGRTIYQRLSQLPNAQVDLWGAVDSEKLVSRFNEILSELTLEQAQDKSQKAPVRRCFIITDAHAVQTLELQLLSRLIQGFPASHVHAVLLMHRNEPYQKKLEVFGKSLLRWELEPEHPAPARMQRIETRDAESPMAASTSAQAASSAPIASTASVLGARQVSRATAGAAAVASPSLASAAPVAELSDSTVSPSLLPEFDRPVAGEMAATAPAATASAKPAARGSRLGWGLLLALLIALTVMAAINLDRIGQELEQLERYVSGKRAAGAPAEGDAAGASSARVNMSSSTQLPVKPDDSLIPDKESIVAPSEGASTSTASGATPAQAATTPASPTPASASPVAAPAAPSVAAPPPAAAPVPEKDPLLGESRQWVRDLPANGWVLQHAALETLDEAKKLKAGASSLQEARILMTQRKAKGYYYIVVTGPYANRAAAQDQMKKNPSWSKAWLRGPKSMQQQFEE